MFDPIAQVALYYLGFGFVILLCWAPAVHTLNAGLPADRAPRYLRLAVAVAGVGLAHPVLVFTARDVVQQLRAELPVEGARALTIVNICLPASVLIAAGVVAIVGW